MQDHVFLTGFVRPVDEPNPLPDEAEWWAQRYELSVRIRRHVANFRWWLNEPAFDDGVLVRLADLARRAAAVDRLWTDVARRLFDVHCHAPVVGAAHLFEWHWAGRSFLTLTRTGELYEATRATDAPFVCVSHVFESVMLKYLRTTIALHQSAIRLVRQDAAGSRDAIWRAISIARGCAKTVLPLHSLPPAHDQLYMPPLFLAPHFWHQWFAALLVAHNRQCQFYLSGDWRTQYDSGHLLFSVLGGEYMPLVLTQTHTLHVGIVGLRRKSLTLSGIAIRLAREPAHRAVAIRLLHWHRIDAASKDAYDELVGDFDTSQLVQPEIERIEVGELAVGPILRVPETYLNKE